ncbi:hypothetical protein ACJMK2_008039 [Sinanodonta woodiana]|uniref:GOLD domain-containing protein n=1 Tax=Sinanodonta woodiana TaxID=1069815 RepID=A0ABD3VNE2_SINWO
MNKKAKITISCVFQCLVCFLLIKSLCTEGVLGVETEAFDFDGNPVTRYGFQVQVDAGKEDCFYQKIRAGSSLAVTYKVLRGVDLNVNGFLKGPNHTIIDTITNKPDGDFNMIVVEPGDYSVCIDNTLSRFSSKLVYIYLVTYLHTEWTQYVQELEEVHVTVSSFTASINSVENSTNEAQQHLTTIRMNFAWHFYWAMRNRIFVQYWALLHCSIFIITSVFQVYFVRRLFRYVNVTPTAKPRA